MVTVTLEGGKELQAKLQTLSRKVGGAIVRNAVREAQKIMLAMAKTNATSMIGGRMGALITTALAVRAAKRRQSKSYSLHVLLKRNSAFYHTNKAGATTYIPAAIEYGHGRNKEQASIPFMRSAAESTRHRVFNAFSQYLRQGIEQIARSG